MTRFKILPGIFGLLVFVFHLFWGLFCRERKGMPLEMYEYFTNSHICITFNI